MLDPTPARPAHPTADPSSDFQTNGPTVFIRLLESGLPRLILGWLGDQRQATRQRPQWRAAAEQLTSRWTTIKQAAETRHHPTGHPPARRSPSSRTPRIGPSGADLTPGR